MRYEILFTPPLLASLLIAGLVIPSRSGLEVFLLFLFAAIFPIPFPTPFPDFPCPTAILIFEILNNPPVYIEKFNEIEPDLIIYWSSSSD